MREGPFIYGDFVLAGSGFHVCFGSFVKNIVFSLGI